MKRVLFLVDMRNLGEQAEQEFKAYTPPDDEPDSRNKRLAHLFGFVRIGEKAGTGIPRIMAGWKSQHWRKPSLTEEYKPSPRTILRLQMLDLFPPGVLDIVRLQFQERFESLDETGRLALATTLTEHRLTHARLSELNFDPSSPNLTEIDQIPVASTSSRDEHGRLISSHFPKPFVDELAHLAAKFREHLEEVAEYPRSSRKIDRNKMVEVIARLCEGRYIRFDCLASLVDRKPGTLQGQYLTQLCREQILRMAFPDKPNDPRQAYTKA